MHIELFTIRTGRVRKRAFYFSFNLIRISCCNLYGSLLAFDYFPGNEWVESDKTFDVLYLKQLYNYLTK